MVAHLHLPPTRLHNLNRGKTMTPTTSARTPEIPRKENLQDHLVLADQLNHPDRAELFEIFQHYCIAWLRARHAYALNPSNPNLSDLHDSEQLLAALVLEVCDLDTDIS
jgi:hypothetical protein